MYMYIYIYIYIYIYVFIYTLKMMFLFQKPCSPASSLVNAPVFPSSLVQSKSALDHEKALDPEKKPPS